VSTFPNEDSPHSAKRRRRRGSSKKEIQRRVYLGCGTLAVIAGVALILIVRATGEPNAGKVIVGGGALALFGIASIIMAITNKLPDDRY